MPNSNAATLRRQGEPRPFSPRAAGDRRSRTHDVPQNHLADSNLLSFELNSELGDHAEENFAPSKKEHGNLITVLVADDHPVVREGLVALIDRQPDMQVIAQASNGYEAVERFFDEAPDVALIDLRMSLMDGLDTVISICESDLTARIGVITSYQNEEDIYRVLQAGARAYILKDAAVSELIECIHAVHDGKTWVPPEVGAKLARRVADQALTPREVQVLNQVVAGKSNKEIGVHLNISQATVKVHMTHILEKLKVTGRTEAINAALRRGLVRLELAPAA